MRFVPWGPAAAAAMMALAPAVWGQATDSVGPCNENYTFVCDQDGSCTCIKNVGINDSYSWGYDPVPWGVYVGPGEHLVILPNFRPAPSSTCEIEYSFATRRLDGNTFGTSSEVGVLTPAIAGRKHATPPAIGGFIAIEIEADAKGCTWDEGRSLNLPYVVTNGSGAVAHRGTAKWSVRFPELAPGELPPILPADSAIRDGGRQ